MSWLCDGDGRAVGRPRFKCDGTCAENRFRLYRRGRQFSRLLAAEVCASTVVMLNTQCSKVVWRALATHTIRQFPLPFLSRASPCAITFQLESTDKLYRLQKEAFSHWCLRRLRSSGMWRCIQQLVVRDISKGRNAFIIRELRQKIHTEPSTVNFDSRLIHIYLSWTCYHYTGLFPLKQ